MKRYAIIILLAGLLPAVLNAGPQTESYTYKVTGGSLSVTNDNNESSAFELKRVSFTIPTANLTNTLTIVHNRKFLLPKESYTETVTSPFTGVVTTNTLYHRGEAATFAQTNVMAAAASDNTQVFDGDNFGWGLTFEEEDIITYSFTETNDFYMILVFDTYPRPAR